MKTITSIKNRVTRAHTRDDGFTLIEVIVSIFLLAVLALGVLPALITNLKATATNASIATASQIANKELEAARNLTTCAAVATYANTTQAVVVDARSISYTPTMTPVICATGATYPGTVKLTVSVALTTSGQVLATGSTLIFVTSAS